MNPWDFGSLALAPAATGFGALSGTLFGKSNGPYQTDYSSMPQYPGYNSVYDPNTQNLSSPDLQKSVKNYFNMAEAPGPSQWAQLTGQQQDALTQKAMANVQPQANSQTANALSMLGGSGGLSSGARERAAEGGATNAMNMEQNLANQNQNNHLQIGINDQQNKMAQMSQVPGMELQALQPQEENIKNTMMGANAKNSFDINKYQTQMQTWAADQQSNAIANAGKHGGMLSGGGGKGGGK